jgi:hypothetical protein
MWYRLRTKNGRIDLKGSLLRQYFKIGLLQGVQHHFGGLYTYLASTPFSYRLLAMRIIVLIASKSYYLRFIPLH